ncbi:hypothetical protein [Rhizobium binae]|uniref:hypothetical protein n=1 Tax=Rhizobium binae TaxID=1138190 RepID=UPI001C82BE88|nr:hypothetical protein [Rhizobium binae]
MSLLACPGEKSGPAGWSLLMMKVWHHHQRGKTSSVASSVNIAVEPPACCVERGGRPEAVARRWTVQFTGCRSRLHRKKLRHAAIANPTPDDEYDGDESGMIGDDGGSAIYLQQEA